MDLFIIKTLLLLGFVTVAFIKTLLDDLKAQRELDARLNAAFQELNDYEASLWADCE